MLLPFRGPRPTLGLLCHPRNRAGGAPAPLCSPRFLPSMVSKEILVKIIEKTSREKKPFRFFFQVPFVIASCRNQIPRTGRLQQHNCTFSQFWRLDGPDPGARWFVFWGGPSPRRVDRASKAFLSPCVCRALAPLLIRTPTLLGDSPTFTGSISLNYLLNAPSADTVPRGVGASTYLFWGHISVHSVCRT